MTDKLPFPSSVPAAARSLDQTTPLDGVRKCPKCGSETRIVANDTGVAAFCGPCNKWWPVSASGTAFPCMPATPGRGITKMVYTDSFVDETWKESPPKEDDEAFLARRAYENSKR